MIGTGSQLVSVLILLMALAMAVAVAASRLRVPYTVALVVAGLGIGALSLLQPPHLTRELLFSVFLPGLVFEAAFHLEFAVLRRQLISVLVLAVPGVVVAMLLTGSLLAVASATLGWLPAMVFGALIAATDPITVVALFRTLGVPAQLSTLLEGESLLNDGTGIVLFGLIVGLAGTAPPTLGQVAAGFVTTVGLGALTGGLFGFVLSRLIRRLDDPMVEITLTTIAAYGSFVVAERLHGSGVIATVIAGLLCGNYGARIGMKPATRLAVETFWQYVAFALNSLVFLLIGFTVQPEALWQARGLILIAFGIVVVTRAVIVLVVSGLLRRTAERLPDKWPTVLTWGGLRGALSIVLALSLAADFPQRDLLVNLTSGVVILSILIQGLSMAPLVRRLGLSLQP
jgi:CPA1 family monovalent cation:H+ antiporter